MNKEVKRTPNSNVSKWSDRIKSQPMFDILKQVKDREAEFPGIVHLEIGDTNGFSNEALRQCIEQSLRSQSFTYSPSIGELYLRESVANRMTAELGRAIDVSEVAIGPANSLITQALAGVCGEGDLVLLPNPGFPTYELAANFLNLEIAYYSVFSNGAPNVQSVDEIRSVIGERKVKAVMICNPSNPLGHAFDWAHFEDLLAYLGGNGAFAIFDETYVNLTSTGVSIQPYNYPSELCIRIRSLSKEFAAPALRIGWCVAPPMVTEVISRFSSMVYSCLPSFIQIGAADYLNSGEGEIFTRHITSEMNQRFQYLKNGIDAAEISLFNMPNATFYAFIPVENEQRMFSSLLEKHRVAVCPGSAFVSQGLNSIRLSLAGPKDDVLAGIDRVLTGLTEE